MSVRFKNLKPVEYRQLVWCSRCDYGLRITVQARRQDHTCAKCDGPMEVYEPRHSDEYCDCGPNADITAAMKESRAASTEQKS